jgi:microcystin-dependent protein
MSDAYLGQILAVGFNFAPVNWALCNGQLLDIATNDALFNLIGTTYGGDGQSTFGLPDLRGRVPIHVGQGPKGLSPYVLGQVGGLETITLKSAEMAQHTHVLQGSNTNATTNIPAANTALANEVIAYQPAIPAYFSQPPADPQNMAPASITAAGNSLPHENRQPYLVINYIICTSGLYPPQS